MTIHRLLPVLYTMLGLAGCDAAGDAPAAAEVTVDTIAGVERVTSTGDGAWGSDDAWRLDTAAAVRIGTLEGAEPYVFGTVAGVVVGADGRIYVADTQAHEVRVFSADGEHLGDLGRDGEGPGEFRNLSGLGRAPGGGVAALDGRLGRVTVFGENGEFTRSLRLERPYMIFAHGAQVRFDAEGRFHDYTPLPQPQGLNGIGVVRYGADGAREDSTVVAVYEPQHVLVKRGEVPVMSFPVPFAPVPSSAIAPDGTVYVTDGSTYAIAQLGASGDTVRLIRRTVEPVPVAAAERDSAQSHIEELYLEAAGAPPRDLPALPTTKPAINALRVDEQGHLWVSRPSTSGGAVPVWDVFAQDHRFLGTVHLPFMNLMHIGERSVAGVELDELDVARVVVVPLDRGE